MKYTSFTFASREEIAVQLDVIEGTIPQDMYGHVYFNSMVGTVNSPPPIPEFLPDGSKNSEYGEMIFNGDGMIFRFDLDTAGIVSVISKLMKPPCYYADIATKYGTEYYKNGLYFKGMGMARNSMRMGARNQLNTSLNAFKFKNDTNTRLTANFDAGRPFEIDPRTLDIKTAVGSNKEWVHEFPNAMENVFPLVQSTAHPSFDPITQEFFTVNFAKSAANLAFSDKKIINNLSSNQDLVTQHIYELHLKLKGKKVHTSTFYRILAQVFEKISDFIQKNKKNNIDLDAILSDVVESNTNLFGMSNAVWLLKWDGSTPIKKWRVQDENGSDLVISQTMHQTNYSKDYIVLVDSSLKFAFDILFSDPFPKQKWLDELIRWITSKTLLPETPLYIIKRKDLLENNNTVIAKKIIIPLETVHYSIDYDNPENIITIHTAHNTASCAAEWIRPYDTLAVDFNKQVHKNTIGLMCCGEMDLGRIGKFLINGETGDVIDQSIISQKGFEGNKISNLTAHTWAVGLNTYRDILSADKVVPKIRKNYWQSYGLDKRLLTKFIWSLYYQYQNRLIPTIKLLEYTKHGIPFCLFRQDTDTMRIDQDFWIFKMNQNLRSLQFVPRKRPNGIPAGIDPDMDGYIFCTMVNGNEDIDNDNDAYTREIWIFDAANLAKGPVCRLSHPDMQYAFTIHSLWVEDCLSSQTNYHVNVKDDYDWVINQFSNQIKKEAMLEFMNKNVYPYF